MYERKVQWLKLFGDHGRKLFRKKCKGKQYHWVYNSKRLRVKQLMIDLFHMKEDFYDKNEAIYFEYICPKSNLKSYGI